MPTAAELKAALGAGTATKKSNPMVSRLKKELEAQAGSKSRLLAKIKDSKATVARTGLVLVTELEAGSTLLLSSIAEGRWGTKMKLGGKVDARLIPGIPLLLAGLYMTATDSPSAPHLTATANGFLASFVASMGVEIGEAWRDKQSKDSTGDVSQTGADSDVSQTGADDDDDETNLSGLRDIALSSSEVDKTDGESPIPGDKNNRFRAAEAL